MNPHPTTNATVEPLHLLLRRRRKELSLIQSQIADELHVSPECIVLWECGRRRMEFVQAAPPCRRPADRC
jgi:DNA-binding XRE family transcriptional regulator